MTGTLDPTAAGTVSDVTRIAALLADARAQRDDVVALQHALHRAPEIGLDLPVTQRLVLDALDGLGLEVTTGTGLSSVVAVLRGGRPGPAVLLRAATWTRCRSRRSRVSRSRPAPGRDARVRARPAHRGPRGRGPAIRPGADLARSVVLMFQPGEEGDHGARVMIDEGVLDAAGERVVAAYTARDRRCRRAW